jgi:hypothetical protein
VPPGPVLVPGTEVPPFGVVLVLVDWVDCVVVARVAVESVESDRVVPLSFELSPMTMISPTARPTTSASRMPTIQRVRVSTTAA